MEDVEIWNNWKKNKNSENNKKILSHVSGRVDYAVSKFSNSGVPKGVLKNHAKKLALKQAESFNPNFNVSLNTHVSVGLKKMSDFVEEEKNVVRIPSYVGRQIPNFLTVKDHLTEKLNREPTSIELADKLSIGVKKVRSLQKEVSRMEIGESASGLDGIGSFNKDEEEDLIKMHYYDIMDPNHKLIYEYSFGLFGKKKIKPKAIAAKVKMSEAQVRRVQQKFAAEIEKFL